MSKGQRSPSKMVGGAKITFRTKPHTCQRCSEGSNIPCVHKDPETPQRLRQNCVWVSPEEAWVSSGLLQELWVWHKLSWRKSRLTPPQSHQNLHRTGETDSWRAQTEPCAHQDPGKRSSDSTRDCLRLAREWTGVSGRGVGQQWPAAGSGALSAAAHAWDLWKEVPIFFITSTVV